MDLETPVPKFSWPPTSCKNKTSGVTTKSCHRRPSSSRCLPCKFQVHARKSGLPCQRALPLPPSYCDGGTAKCSRMRFSSIFSSLARRGPSTHHPVSLPRASNRSRARSRTGTDETWNNTDPGPKSALSRQAQTNPGLHVGTPGSWALQGPWLSLQESGCAWPREPSTPGLLFDLSKLLLAGTEEA